MNLFCKNDLAKLILFLVFLSLPSLLYAETATFDELSEGIIGSELTDGGITFFNLDNGNPNLQNVFIIEQADEALSGSSFSDPNGLTATGYTPGADAGFGPVKEMFMTTGSDADSAVIEVFTMATQLYGNTVTIEAIKDDTVVDSESVTIADVDSDHFTLTLENVVFDTLRVFSSPNPQVLMLDNVTINSISGGEGNDIDLDCDMDGNDLAILASELGRDDCTDATPCQADLNSDNVVDDLDLKIATKDFGNESLCE